MRSLVRVAVPTVIGLVETHIQWPLSLHVMTTMAAKLEYLLCVPCYSKHTNVISTFNSPIKRRMVPILEMDQLLLREVAELASDWSWCLQSRSVPWAAVDHTWEQWTHSTGRPLMTAGVPGTTFILTAMCYFNKYKSVISQISMLKPKVNLTNWPHCFYILKESQMSGLSPTLQNTPCATVYTPDTPVRSSFMSMHRHSKSTFYYFFLSQSFKKSKFSASKIY